jgi:hypothetical protein
MIMTENASIQGNLRNLGYEVLPLKYTTGYMLVSKSTYLDDNSGEIDCLGNYQYKHRFYYYEKFNDDVDKKDAMYIIFNPGIANPEKDDQVIKNCRALVKDGYKGMGIINIFSERNPLANFAKFDISDILSKGVDLNSILNKTIITKYLDGLKGKSVDIIIAWGSENEHKDEYSTYFEDIKKKIGALKSEKNVEIKCITVSTDDVNKNILDVASSNLSEMGEFEKIAKLEPYVIVDTDE